MINNYCLSHHSLKSTQFIFSEKFFRKTLDDMREFKSLEEKSEGFKKNISW